MKFPTVTFGRLLAGVAVLLLVSTGAAVAAATITSANIVDGTIRSVDVRDGTLQSVDVRNGTLRSADVLDGSLRSADVLNGSLSSADLLDESLLAADLANNSVGGPEIQTDAVGATEIQDNSIDSGEIVDFGLSNQDVGVLFAQVSAAGVVDNSTGGVSVIKLGSAGNYEVDFSRNITACAFVATVAPSGSGSALGEVNVADRGGNAEAVFVDTNNPDGVGADKPFTLMVVC